LTVRATSAFPKSRITAVQERYLTKFQAKEEEEKIVFFID